MNVSDAVRGARALVGCKFRPQGRDPESGLDCVGVICSVFGIEDVPRNYRLRGNDRPLLRRTIERHFMAIENDRAQAGDVLLLEAGHDQLHLAILTDRGYVHADARSRLVVEVPGRAPWPVVAAYRFRGQAQRKS